MTNPTNPIDQLTSNKGKEVARQTIQAGDRSRISDVQQEFNKKGNRATEQLIVTGRDSELDRVLQQMVHQTTFKTAEHDFFFDMVLLKVVRNEQGNEQVVELKHDDALEPGCTYVVRIAISLDRYQHEGEGRDWKMQQEGVKTRGNVLFSVQELCPVGVEGAIETCEPIWAEIPEEDDGSWCKELRIKVKETHGLAVTTLQLQYELANHQPRTVTRLENVNLSKPAGSVLLPEKMYCYLAVNAEPPNNTAILHIWPTGENQAMCIRWFKEQKDAPTGFPPLELPQISPCDYSEIDEYLQAIEHGLNDLARNETTRVGLWFEEVLSRYRENGCIILVDQTEAQLPWEMFKLSNGEYLGAKVVVVRWMAEQFRGKNVELLLEKSEQEGHVTVYSSSPRSPNSVLHTLAHDPCDQLPSLQYALLPQENASIAGLVYLSCHNMLKYGDEADALARLFSSSQQMQQLRFDDIEGQLSHRPIFVVETPYSGRMLWTKGKSCGLMKAVLTQVASGYIGTLASVNPSFAHYVTNELLKKACSNPIRPAYFLKLLRAFFVKQFQEAMRSRQPEEINRQKRLLLYAFTYVYYGNPQTFLKIVPYRSPAARG